MVRASGRIWAGVDAGAGWVDNPGGAYGPDNSVEYGGYCFDLAGATVE